MPQVVGVMFKDRSKVVYYSPGDLALTWGMEVVAESNRGLEVGMVVAGVKLLSEGDIEPPLRAVTRVMTEADRSQHLENERKNRDAFRVCEELIAKHKLSMRLVEADQTFDCNRIFFYFVSEERVDFRNLVKDLAAALKKRIQLQQIGVRDSAKRMGGCGPCGRELCCSTWLRGFDPISIRMAKDQGLPLNPTKLSGVCGRLKCCLRYENKFYQEMNKLFPKLGSQYPTEKGNGRVLERNLLTGHLIVDVPEHGRCVCACTPADCNRRG